MEPFQDLIIDLNVTNKKLKKKFINNVFLNIKRTRSQMNHMK